MKTHIVILTSILIAMSVNATLAYSTGGNQSVQINSNDSVIFDVTAADCFFDKVQFPVYIKSDEDVYAIDFAMKYDITKIAFDSLIVLKPYLFASINYNSSDSTLRFSGFSIQPVEAGDDLINLRFRKIAPLVDSVGFHYIATFLNGDSCSNYVNQYISRPVVSPAGPLSINAGDSITLQVNTTPGYSYLWSTGDTSTSVRISSQGVYSVTATNVHGCTISSSIAVNPGIPLPVELLLFRSEKKGNAIQLNWVTVSESENDFFSVEKLYGNKEWSIIIKGHGNSSVPLYYTALDENPDNGTNYYQLQQTDYNGKKKIIGQTSCNYTKDMEGFTFYPNPVDNELHIESSENGILQIFRMDGRAAMSSFAIDIESSNTINVSYLHSGNYILKYQIASQQYTGRFYKK